MGMEKIISGLTKCSSIEHIRPPFTMPKLPKTINPNELRLCPNFKSAVGDVVRFTETTFKKPSAEELSIMLKEQGLELNMLKDSFGKSLFCGIIDKPSNYIIKDNNSMFLRPLLERFPKRAEETVNLAVQKRMLYISDIDHSKFLDKHKFLEQFLKDIDNVENIMAKDGTKLYSDTAFGLYSKKAILQAKYNNPERYQELTDLIQLYQKGLVPRHNVQHFFPNAHFHPLIKSDMQKLLNGDNYYPQFEKLSQETIAQLEHGEAFSVRGKMFVKTVDGYEELKMDKTTYEKLFPAVERYSISQQGISSNCGKIASWNAMIKNPTSRVELYKMFEQTENGVIVNIPNCNYIQEFNWSNLQNINTAENLQGSLGHRMLEYTYDMNKLGHIDMSGGARGEMISTLLGKSEIPTSFRCPMTSVHKKYLAKNTNGIYVDNSARYSNLNNGSTEAHYYSTNDLTSGLWQNPWTGVEEMNLGTAPCYYGSAHWFGGTLGELL